ncbi:MAG: molybdenum cofactor guanylyltransferase [Promethearchaeota archaeon]
MNDENLTVAILVGGASKRFKAEKYTAAFQGRPLIVHMADIAKQISNRVIIATSTNEQAEEVRKLVKWAEVAVDPEESDRAALVGALTAFEYAESKYTLLLPVDTPLANVGLLRVLVDLAEGHGAVVPSWPSGYIEPLHAVYLTEHAYLNGLKTLENGRRRMQELLDNLTNVLYVSTLILKEMDPELSTFDNVNTSGDLRALEKKVAKRV